MFNRKIAPVFRVGLFFLAVSAFGQVSATSTNYTLPPVGLAASETAQVNVVNTAVASSTGTAASCTGSITFYNASGIIIGQATKFTVGSGQIFSATLPFASTGASGSRTIVRAEIVSTAIVAGFAVPPCTLESSLETYDSATGVTHVFLAGGPVRIIRMAAML